jgi:signal transduction histidine kinase
MHNIVQESLDRLNLMITERDAKITLPTEWPIVLGYSTWIEEVWVNYISNALKYGGNPPEITLGAMSQNDGYVRFWVEDNGNGLTEAERASLFTKFTRLSDKKIDGYGLGLSIVERIIKKCGGQVGVQSQVNKGSIFYFTLQKG